jgi:hypothetical protein
MNRTTIARAMKGAFDELSPFIENHTQTACPACKKVCCIDRHGTYEEEDILFLEALGEKPETERPREEDTLPCRYLAPGGCRLRRHRRPFRCTWYFCNALLESMPGDVARKYRVFIKTFQDLQELRRRLLSHNDNGTAELAPHLDNDI